MTQDHGEVAAAAMVEAGLAGENLIELHGRLTGCFRRVEPFRQAGTYITGLMSDLPRKNGWTLAEAAGDAGPDRMQRLLNHASWDTLAAMAVVRGFVVERLAAPFAVAVLDETGQEKKGTATAGVKRQYMGCADGVANGVNTVHCSYATPRGHALVGARPYLPKEQLADAERCAALGIPADTEFRTKPQLAIDILTDALADGASLPWCTGDEVYGRSGQLRGFLEDRRIGYVLAVPANFSVTVAAGTKMRVDVLARKIRSRWWMPASAGQGSKGERMYAWAWVATASDRHHLLIRRSLTDPADLAFFYCHVPHGRPVTLSTLVAVAGMRWPVEEDFQFGKDQFGLDHSQVRLYTALLRHTVLAMAALAVCAVTAADAKTRTNTLPPPPTHPDDEPPEDPGLTPLTVAEVRRLFALLTRPWRPLSRYLHWSWWRRRHQARAKWFHHRTRLRRQTTPP